MSKETLRTFLIANRDQVIDEVMNRFDFVRTIKQMRAVEWRYWDEPHPLPQQCVERTAHYLLGCLIDDLIAGKDATYWYSGGIKASYSPGRGEMDTFILEFIGTDCGYYVDLGETDE